MAVSMTQTSKAPSVPDPSRAQFLTSISPSSADDLKKGQELLLSVIRDSGL